MPQLIGRTCDDSDNVFTKCRLNANGSTCWVVGTLNISTTSYCLRKNRDNWNKLRDNRNKDRIVINTWYQAIASSSNIASTGTIVISHYSRKRRKDKSRRYLVTKENFLKKLKIERKRNYWERDYWEWSCDWQSRPIKIVKLLRN